MWRACGPVWVVVALNGGLVAIAIGPSNVEPNRSWPNLGRRANETRLNTTATTSRNTTRGGARGRMEAGERWEEFNPLQCAGLFLLLPPPLVLVVVVQVASVLISLVCSPPTLPLSRCSRRCAPAEPPAAPTTGNTCDEERTSVTHAHGTDSDGGDTVRVRVWVVAVVVCEVVVAHSLLLRGGAAGCLPVTSVADEHADGTSSAPASSHTRPPPPSHNGRAPSR